MINTSAIEIELASVCAEAFTFKSSSTGRIRETVPDTAMPGLDISALPVRSEHKAGYIAYRVPVLFVIRVSKQNRDDGSARLKQAIDAIITVFESYKGTSFDVLRDVLGRAVDDDNGSGSPVRIGIIQATAYKN